MTLWNYINHLNTNSQCNKQKVSFEPSPQQKTLLLSGASEDMKKESLVLVFLVKCTSLSIQETVSIGWR